MYKVLSFIWIPNSFKIVDLTECPPGYFNPLNDLKCSRPCGYPTYGVRCGNECDCLEMDCHHVTVYVIFHLLYSSCIPLSCIGFKCSVF